MLLLPEFGRPYLIQSLDSPVIPKYFWNFSGPMLDFVLSPIHYLEETCGPTVAIMLNGFKFSVPASWNILVVDRDTSMVDSVPIHVCSTNMYTAFLLSSTTNRYSTADIHVVGYEKEEYLVHPMIQKATMMCHPIGPDTNQSSILSAMIGPYDLYQKYLANVSACELLY
jgi:hypothetical protein